MITAADVRAVVYASISPDELVVPKKVAAAFHA
jgi:hypothetical protein